MIFLPSFSSNHFSPSFYFYNNQRYFFNILSISIPSETYYRYNNHFRGLPELRFRSVNIMESLSGFIRAHLVTTFFQIASACYKYFNCEICSSVIISSFLLQSKTAYPTSLMNLIISIFVYSLYIYMINNNGRLAHTSPFSQNVLGQLRFGYTCKKKCEFLFAKCGKF